MKKTLTFDQLPEAIARLIKEVSELRQLLLQRNNQHSSIPAEKILTVKEAADFLNLTVPTVYSKVSKGELPVMKRGKKLHFSNTELIQFLKDGRKKTNIEIEEEAIQYLNRVGERKIKGGGSPC